jgi:hypothetical protein
LCLKAWILNENFNLGIEMLDDLQMDLIGDCPHDQLLVVKNSGSFMAKVYDLNLMESRNEVYMDKGSF